MARSKRDELDKRASLLSRVIAPAPEPGSEPAAKTPRKKRRWKQRWASEVRKYQKTANPIIPLSAFNRVVREIATSDDIASVLPGARFTRSALEALQCGAESFVTNILADANNVAVKIGHRSTILPVDFEHAVAKHTSRADGA